MGLSAKIALALNGEVFPFAIQPLNSQLIEFCYISFIKYLSSLLVCVI